MASKTLKSNKKVDEVKEVIQNKPDADIAKILELFENDVAKTINAFMADGGKTALSQWAFNKKSKKTIINESDNKPNKTNTNKKSNKNNANKSKNTENTTSNNNSDVNDLVSSIINQSINTPLPTSQSTANKIIATKICEESAISLNSQVHSQQNILNNLNNLIISSQSTNSSKAISGLNVKVIGIEQSNGNKQMTTTNQSSLTSSPSSMSATSTSSNFDNNKQGIQSNNNQFNKIQLNNQFFQNNNQNINMNFTNPNNTKNVLEKSQKDLLRQTTVLTRTAAQFQEELNKSQFNCNQQFMILRNLLDQRQNQLQANLNTVAHNATQLLMQRQHKAAQLKSLADNAIHLNDNDTLEFKADIKHFVSERLLDEEFAKIKIFHDDNLDQLNQSINSFGRIAQVNVKYATKRPPIEEVLNNSFTASSPIQQQQQIVTNGNNNNSKKQNNKNSASNVVSNRVKATNETLNTNGRHSIKIIDFNGFSDDNNEDEGEFIEVKKPQRNKNKAPSNNLTNNHNGNHTNFTNDNKTTVNNTKKTYENGTNASKMNGKTTNGTIPTNGENDNNSNNIKKKKKKNNKNGVATEPIPKANINPFSLIANGN